MFTILHRLIARDLFAADTGAKATTPPFMTGQTLNV